MRIRVPEEGQYGLYRVTGRRAYRGHEPGTEFSARIEREAERRAVARGDIELLDRLIPALEPGSFAFPRGWLIRDSHHVRNRGPRGPLS